MKNKKTVVILLVIMMLSLVGCSLNSNSQVDINKQIIEKVKAYEINEYEFRKLEFSYDDFKEKMKDIVVAINYFDNEDMFGYSNQEVNRMYKAKDLAGLSIEEIKVLQEDVESDSRKSYEEKGWNYDKRVEEMKKLGSPYFEFKISGVYDDDGHDWKYVYSNVYTNWFSETYTNKRYRFVNEDGIWRIINVDESFLNWNENLKEYGSKEEFLKKLKYQTFNNEPVEYIETFIIGENK